MEASAFGQANCFSLGGALQGLICLVGGFGGLGFGFGV